MYAIIGALGFNKSMDSEVGMNLLYNLKRAVNLAEFLAFLEALTS